MRRRWGWRFPRWHGRRRRRTTRADALRAVPLRADARRAAVVRRKVRAKVGPAGPAEGANDPLEDVLLAEGPGEDREGLVDPELRLRHPIRAVPDRGNRLRAAVRLADGQVKVTAEELRRGHRQGPTGQARGARRALGR